MDNDCTTCKHKNVFYTNSPCIECMLSDINKYEKDLNYEKKQYGNKTNDKL